MEPMLVERVLDEVGAGRIEPALGGLGAVEGAEPGHGSRRRTSSSSCSGSGTKLAAGSSTLRVETLDRLGGAQRIVEEHLQSAMDELTPEQKDIAARIFNHLVTPSGTKIAHEASDLADFAQVGEEIRRCSRRSPTDGSCGRSRRGRHPIRDLPRRARRADARLAYAPPDRT